MRTVRRISIYLLPLIALTGIAAFAIPASRCYVLGAARGEGFYRGRPMSYWLMKLDSDDPIIRRDALFCLGQIGASARSAVGRITVHLDDPDMANRSAAAVALYKIGPGEPPAIEALTKALSDPSPEVRINATMALTRYGPAAASAVDSLLEALRRDENRRITAPFHHSVRQQVCRCLGRIGRDAEPAVPDLIEALMDGDSGVRVHAAYALGRIGPASTPAIEQLELCRLDENRNVQEAAVEALRAIRGTTKLSQR